MAKWKEIPLTIENRQHHQEKYLIQRWENFPCASTFSCCVVDFISSHLRSVVRGNKTRQQSEASSFFSPQNLRNFVSLFCCFRPYRPQLRGLFCCCFILPNFLLLFCVLCFPFLLLRSDTIKKKKSELKNLRLASSPSCEKQWYTGGRLVDNSRTESAKFFILFVIERLKKKRLKNCTSGFLVGVETRRKVHRWVHMW